MSTGSVISPIRVLRIKNGETRDEEGRRYGDDWVLADFGEDFDGDHYYLTTNRLHASEYARFTLFEPGNLSKFIQEQIDIFLQKGLTDT